jgi:hypothetical protein
MGNPASSEGAAMAKARLSRRLEEAEALIEKERKATLRELLDFVGAHPDEESFWRVSVALTGGKDEPDLTGGVSAQPEDWERANAMMESLDCSLKKQLRRFRLLD